ncbi:N-acetyltransferase family protein [Streptomyces sp. NPDC002144]
MTSTQTLLRTADVGDVEGITELHTQARTAYYAAGGVPTAELDSPEAYARRREGWLRAVRADDMTVVCAEQAGELAGILMAGPPYEPDVDAETVGQLYQIHVRPGSWGQGVGGRLHAEFVRLLRDASLATGVLEAWARNSRAQDFYVRHGWRPDGHHRPGPGGADYVRMRLHLAQQGLR